MTISRVLHALGAVPMTLAMLGISPVPLHIQTADYYGGYAGTRSVDPQVAARWLTWAETGVADSPPLRRLGIETMLYTNPNRVITAQAEFQEYSQDESTFAHDCTGARVQTSTRPGQYLMNPHSATLRAVWKKHVDRYASIGHFDAIFSDDANNVRYVSSAPCNFDAGDWLRATNALQQSLGYPIIYNALSDFSDQTVSSSIGLNATAIGGMMEQCYAPSPREPESPGDHWLVTENTELQMMGEHKLFFCYGNDTTAAESALDARLYVYASFLLSYDPSFGVLWEYYDGSKRFHVMPEVQLVALQPREQPRSIADLRTPAGIYERQYAACYLAGRGVGPCAVAVNPDSVAHSLALQGYTHTLELTGGSVVDGGSVRVSPPAPSTQLTGLSAVIAFK